MSTDLLRFCQLAQYHGLSRAAAWRLLIAAGQASELPTVRAFAHAWKTAQATRELVGEGIRYGGEPPA